MIGRIEFDGAAGTTTATLKDNQTWTCEDPDALRDLTDRAIPAEGYLPPQQQLYAASSFRGTVSSKSVRSQHPTPTSFIDAR